MRRTAVFSLIAGLVLAAGLLLVLNKMRVQQPGIAEKSSGNMTVRAEPASARAGDTVHLTVVATGPLTYDDCYPVTFWATDVRGRKVWASGHFWICATHQLGIIASGKQHSFASDWPTSGMANGVYSVHGVFLQSVAKPGDVLSPENLPVVTVTISG